MDEIIKDDRFKHIATDSRFRNMKKSERKFKVDNRFKNMFHDKKFKLKYSVDKRGKPITHTTNDNLKKFYELSDSDDDEDDDDEDDDNEKKDQGIKEKKENKKPDNKKIEIKTKSDASSDSDENEAEENEEEDDDSGEGESDSRSKSTEPDTSDEEDDSELDEEEEVEIPWNEFDKDTERSDEVSSRLAVCNMDWDRIKAEDLFIMLNSFKPANGTIKSVKVYLSDFGVERMEYEKMNGPQELTQNLPQDEKTIDSARPVDDGSDDEEKSKFYNDDDDDDGDNYDRLKLRTYQFNRLKYYYAVVDCDSSETANRIYTECDGMEYESSCTRLDLRFIPDQISFEDNRVTQTCLEMPDPLTYKPNLFFTTALNQTKVECTWDETPRDRLAITMKKYTEEDLKTSSFKSILASGSEDEKDDDEDEEDIEIKKKEKLKSKKSKSKKEDQEEDGIQKYRDLLFGQEAKQQKKREADLEFCWEGGVEDESDEDDDDDLLVSKKTKTKTSNKPERNKKLTEEEIKEQAQLSLLTMDDNDVGKAHFNLDDLLVDKNKKSKKNKKKLKDNEDGNNNKDDFELNVKDPRFSAIFYDHKFNIDPSDQLFKKTKAMEILLEEKSKRKFDEIKEAEANEKIEESESKSTKVDPSALLLVKSIKSRNEVLERKKLNTKEKQKALKNKLRLLK